MIKIISGVYGYRDPVTGSVVPKTSKDEPFSLSPEQEERLVSLKVAEYVDAEGAETAQATLEVGGNETQPDAEKTVHGGAEEPERADNINHQQVQVLLDEMSAKDLREYGKGLGLTFKVGMTKAEMREQIEAELQALNGEDDGDEPPTFDAAEAVQ